MTPEQKARALAMLAVNSEPRLTSRAQADAIIARMTSNPIRIVNPGRFA